MTRELVVVGDPTGRRTRLIRDALKRSGQPEARIISWGQVLNDGGVEASPTDTVWLDSPGDSADIDRLLRGPGDQTRIGDGPRWYQRFCDAASSVRGGRLLSDPADIAILFDKRVCHEDLTRASVPVPASPTSGGEVVADWTQVRRLTSDAGMRRFFVKPAHGSSAAGVVAVETASGGRVQARSSAELCDGRTYNSLRVRTYRGERDVASLIDALAPENLHIEAWIPKPTVGGRSADLRVVVVAGVATHAVLRLGASPMTNLHLGGTRGDLTVAVNGFRRAGVDWDGVLGVAEDAARCFPRTFCVGVDLLPTSGWRGVVVGEVNAFGDLLPGLAGLPGRADGLDTYDAQIAALDGWRCDDAA